MATHSPGERAMCPYCRTMVRFEGVHAVAPMPPHGYGRMTSATEPTIFDEGGEAVRLTIAKCSNPPCGKAVITLERLEIRGTHAPYQSVGAERLVWPHQSNRAPVPAEVPQHIADDYNEAALVLADSPKASAALSRRCLQTVLREQGFEEHDLSKQIDSALPTLPTHVSGVVDAIRNFGNFAAHQQTDRSSGAILDVEPGEAEWSLDVLEALFDFYYVRPAKQAQQKAALNAKLQAAGKPPMK